MKRRFRYSPVRVDNFIIYTGFLFVILAVLSKYGEYSWQKLTSYFSLFEIIVLLGFSLYMVLFWSLGGFYLWFDHLCSEYRLGKLVPENLKFKIARYLGSVEIQIPAGLSSSRTAGVKADVPIVRAIYVVLRNQIFGTWPIMAMVYWILVQRGLSLEMAPPGPITFVLQLSGLILCEEIMFYSTHRILHWGPLFRRVHRIHHEYRKTIGIATHYVHFLEHLFGNLLPVFSGVLLIVPHPYVIFTWISLAVTNAIHSHGGYAFWGMGYAVDHDYHHYRMRGNYGVLGLMDALFGTSREFRALAGDRLW